VPRPAFAEPLICVMRPANSSMANIETVLLPLAT
jgi:hypothetical protein